MKKNRVLILGILVASSLMFFGAVRWYQSKNSVAPQDERLVRSHSPRTGNEGAPVTLVEFYDPECESCSAFYPVVKQVMKEFDGKILLVLRYMNFHHNSAYAASLLEATRPKGKYFEALELLFARQHEWGSHDSPRPELILTYLQSLGLDPTEIAAAAKDPQIQSRILQDQDDGTALGVRGTPTFFVNGKMVMGLSYESLREAVQKEL